MKDEEKTESRRQKAESSQDYIVLPPAACLLLPAFRLHPSALPFGHCLASLSGS